MKKYKLVNKRRFYSFVLMAALFLSLSLMFTFDREKVQGQAIDEYETIVIEYGDTLWNIANKYNHKNEDVRKVVYQLRKDNNLTNDYIQPDQTLKVPKAY